MPEDGAMHCTGERASVKREDFLRLKKCQRCGRDLITGRKMSWFNEQAICLHCSAKEEELKRELEGRGLNLRQFEGCGYIPRISGLRAKA